MRDAPPAELRPNRKFGIVQHTFPEMTGTEKRFVWAFIASGCILLLLLRDSVKQSTVQGQLALCAGIMGGTLAYWMRQEPAAVLDLLVFPYTGGRLWFGRPQVRWPRWVLASVRVFGVVSFFGAVSGVGALSLPQNWTSNGPNAPGLKGLILLAIEVGFCFYVLRERKGPQLTSGR